MVIFKNIIYKFQICFLKTFLSFLTAQLNKVFIFLLLESKNKERPTALQFAWYGTLDFLRLNFLL